jgi:hypothetical protein
MTCLDYTTTNGTSFPGTDFLALTQPAPKKAKAIY